MIKVTAAEEGKTVSAWLAETATVKARAAAQHADEVMTARRSRSRANHFQPKLSRRPPLSAALGGPGGEDRLPGTGRGARRRYSSANRPATAAGVRVTLEGVPGVASADALVLAAAEFAVTDLDLVAELAAIASARRSADESGLLLLGEVHGVRENPLLAGALMQALGLTGLALEWHEDLAPAVEAFLATGTLADHWLLWPGDGRITAGHLGGEADG